MVSDRTAPSLRSERLDAALDEGEQRRILRQLRSARRPCAFVNEAVAGAWLAGRPRPETALVRYIFDHFEVVETSGAFEFMLPRPARRG